jgi:hypothetical protein
VAWLIGTFTQQDVDLDRVFADVAVYNQRVMGPRTWRTWPRSPAAWRSRGAGWRTSTSRSICNR